MSNIIQLQEQEQTNNKQPSARLQEKIKSTP
jgi:hypothetical protein